METPKIIYESGLDDFNDSHHSDENLHDEMMNVMSRYLDEEPPQVGIFWYDIVNKCLFGVSKGDAQDYIEKNNVGTLHKLHKTYWQKQHHRAVAKNQTDSIFFNEKNYTNIPRGRVFVRPDGTVYVAVGDWFYGNVNGVKTDTETVRELIADEFNLPDDFEVHVDEHWNLGHGWSSDKF